MPCSAIRVRSAGARQHPDKRHRHLLIASVQDDWRVSEKLTVNLGMMYQFGSRRTTRRTVSATCGSVATRHGRVFRQLALGIGESAAGACRRPRFGCVQSCRLCNRTRRESRGWGRALVGSDKNDVAPRLGIAYQMDDKTVIRTGFGIFYNSTFVQELQDLRKFWPFTPFSRFSAPIATATSTCQSQMPVLRFRPRRRSVAGRSSRPTARRIRCSGTSSSSGKSWMT